MTSPLRYIRLVGRAAKNKKHPLYAASFGVYLDVTAFIERIIELSNPPTSHLYFHEKSPTIADMASHGRAVSSERQAFRVVKASRSSQKS